MFLSKNNYFDLYIFVYRIIIHYKCGLYHGMEHGLIMFRPAIVRDILPVEWTCTSRRPCGPVYIDLPGSRLIAVQWTCTKLPPLRTWSTLIRLSVPVCNTGTDFSRLRRSTTWRTICSSAPVYNTGPAHLLSSRGRLTCE